jgi:hypothetical protein
MRSKSIFTLLLLTAVATSIGINEARAGFPAPPGFPPPPGLPGSPNVNVRINGFLPAPPGVHVLVDSGRPYYVERDRRVYMEREKPSKHYKKKKYHKDNGRREHGHDRHDH